LLTFLFVRVILLSVVLFFYLSINTAELNIVHLPQSLFADDLAGGNSISPEVYKEYLQEAMTADTELLRAACRECRLDAAARGMCLYHRGEMLRGVNRHQGKLCFPSGSLFATSLFRCP
jgi:hypothetical protein